MDFELVSGMLDKAYAWSVARTYSREEAEELTQEILFQALKSLRNLRDRSKFEPWFWRLADNTLKVYKRGKAKNRHVMSFDEVAAVPVEDDHRFIEEEQLHTLRRNIAQMSAAYRDILVMYYYDNLSCREISQKLGLPEGTVTYRLSLAREKLKKECGQMNEQALKPRQLNIRITGEFNISGQDVPMPWQYIDDALSHNILLHAYREPKTVEQLSKLTGVPAFYIEDRVQNLIRREAVIRPTPTTVQTNFLIFDETTSRYSAEQAPKVVEAVSGEFYALSRQLAESVIPSSGLQASGRSFDELLCLLSVMLLDQTVSEYRPSEYTPIPPKYDGRHWDYTGTAPDSSGESAIGVGMEKSMNNYESGKLAHYVYHFAPFAYRKMMYDFEIDVCHAVVNHEQLDEQQKEIAAKMIAGKYLARNEANEIVCTIPVFTKTEFERYLASAKAMFADFLPRYTELIKQYLHGYIRLFPKHLREAAERNGYHIYVAMFKAIADDWLRNGKIHIPSGAVCDVLVMM